MTDDAILRNFLLDAAAVEFSAELSDTTPVDASPRLRRQMTAMLNDPNDWAKRQHRPVWNRLARTAAVILLTCFLSLGALMAISPTVRAAVITWVRETYEHSVVYNLVWIDETRGIVFTINSTLEKDVILRIAESASLSNLSK